MKLAIAFISAIFLASLATRPAMAKGSSVGIYAIIDQVTFDKDGPSPNLIRISGVFAVPVPMSSADYQAPQRGYLYFRIPPGAEHAAQEDWKQLKAAEGTRQVVGFAFYWVPNPADPGGNPHHSLEVSIHLNGESAQPEDYPISNPNGVVRAGTRDSDFDPRVAASLLNFVK